MSRPLPPLNALRAFDAAGRHQSFSLAAQELNVSHSAISRHVRGLEARLGVQLFRDLPRGVELTRDGRAYLARVMPAFDAIAEATEGLTEAPAGRVTVNSDWTFALRVILPRIAEFHDAYPDIDLRLEASQRLADVEHYEADLAVRFAHRGSLDMPSDLMSDAPLLPFACPEIAARIRTPADLLAERRYKDRMIDSWHRWFELCAVPGPLPVDEGWSYNAVLALEAALQGAGVYLGSAECTVTEQRAGRLVRLFDTGFRDGAFFLVYGSRGPRGAAVRAFRSWVLDITAGFRDWDGLI